MLNKFYNYKASVKIMNNMVNNKLKELEKKTWNTDDILIANRLPKYWYSDAENQDTKMTGHNFSLRNNRIPV